MNKQYQDPSQMSIQELMSLTLKESAPTVESLFSRFSSVKDIFEATYEELCTVNGVGPSRALRIKALTELANRYLLTPTDERPTISQPSDAYNLLRPQIKQLHQETFWALLLNTKNQVISQITVSIGTLNSTLVHPREVFRHAIRKSSAAIIIAHNHPSGNPDPSDEDITLTKRLVEAGQLLGVSILDHVVISDGRFYSFRQQGLI